MPAEEPIKMPLSTWEKIKAGVKGFAKTVMHYAPRGLLFSGIIFAGSAGLGMINPSLDLLGVATATSGQLLKHLATSLVIGSVISGTMGAWQTVEQETVKREAEIEAQGQAITRSRTPERQKDIDYMASYVPHSGLPHAISKDPTILM